MKNHAFTLAEVLITLGIIGVVAAMTLPTLVQKQQEKAWVTAYLRVYSLLETAYHSAIAEYGTVENWDGSSISYNDDGEFPRIIADKNTIYKNMIKPYFKVNREFMELNGNQSGCMPPHYKHLSGQTSTNYFNSRVPQISLPSGECICLDPTAFGNFVHFVVDLNGQKNPNTLGKDIFIFSFDVRKPGRIKPGYNDIWWTDMPEYCDTRSDNGWISGMSCGLWIVRNHNMDYLHMPFEELKKKWDGGVW